MRPASDKLFLAGSFFLPHVAGWLASEGTISEWTLPVTIPISLVSLVFVSVLCGLKSQEKINGDSFRALTSVVLLVSFVISFWLAGVRV